MLSTNSGKLLNKYVKNYVVFDLKTTGISVTKDKVVEISAVKVLDSEAIEEFSTLMNPCMHIPKETGTKALEED